MSSVSIRVDVDSEAEQLIRRLDRIRGIDKAGVMNAVAEGLRTSTQERFRTETAPDGSKWKPSVRAVENNRTTLTASAALKTHIYAKADASGAAIGTNIEYAATHQFGAERTIRARNGKYLKFTIGGKEIYTPSVRIKIPARPFLGIGQTDEEEIRELIEDAFEET